MNLTYDEELKSCACLARVGFAKTLVKVVDSVPSCWLCTTTLVKDAGAVTKVEPFAVVVRDTAEVSVDAPELLRHESDSI